MSKFTDLYIQKNQGRENNDIINDPISALVTKNYSPNHVVHELRKAGWDENEIEEVFDIATKAMTKVK